MFRMLRYSAVITVAALCSCHAEDPLFIMSEESIVDARGARYIGGGCTAIQPGSFSSGGGGAVSDAATSASYRIEYQGLDDGARVVVTGGNQRIERVFDRNWLRGARPGETLEVRIDDSLAYRIYVYGGPNCVPPRPPDEG